MGDSVTTYPQKKEYKRQKENLCQELRLQLLHTPIPDFLRTLWRYMGWA
jgi:hypothetical protein